MKTKPPKDARDIEVYPDAWERFEKAVDTVMKAPPKHQPAPQRKAKGAPRDQGAGTSREISLLMIGDAG
jgi:hypothetical protein